MRETLARELAQLQDRAEARLAELSAAQEETRRELEAARASRPSHLTSAEESGAAVESSQIPEEEAADESLQALTLARAVEDFFNSTTHPRQLLGDETFLRAVGLARAGRETTLSLLANGAGYDALVACMSLEAVARREGEDEAVEFSVLRDINSYYYRPRFYALHALGLTSEHLADVNLTLKELGDALPEALKDEAERWLEVREASEFVKTFGRVWEPGARGESSEGEVFMLDSVEARVAEVESAIKRELVRDTARGWRTGRLERVLEGDFDLIT
jgi:hypothetical protein